MRILFVTYSLKRGGAERQLTELASILKQRGHTVTVATSYDDDPYIDVIRQSGVEVISLLENSRTSHKKKPLIAKIMSRLRVIQRLVALASRRRFDVIYGFGREPNLDALISRPLHKTPVVWGVRNSLPGTRHPFSILEERLSSLADLVIVNSVAGKDVLLQRGFPEHKLRVVENGIDTERFTIDERSGLEMRCSFNIEPDADVVGIVARLDPVKNHEMFIRAAARISQERRVIFLIVGRIDETRYRSLEDLALELGVSDRLVWTGERKDVELLINAMDVCVLCSWREGFPNVVAEAMACGVPCAVTDVGDSKRIVDGVGKAVPANDSNALAKAISELLSDKRSIDRQSVRHEITSRWGLNRLAEKSEACLDEVVSG